MPRMPRTESGLLVWVMAAPTGGYAYIKIDNTGYPAFAYTWIQYTLQQWPKLVAFKRNGYYLGSMIRTWSIHVAGVYVGTVPNHERENFLAGVYSDR